MICPCSASPGRPTPRVRQHGAALFAVIPIVMLMMSLMVAFVGATLDTSRAATSGLDSFRSRAAAQSVASLAVADLWGDFEAISTGNDQIWTFRAYLDGLGLLDQQGMANPAKTDLLPALALATDMDGDPTLGGVEVARVDVHRLDNWDSTSLVVEVEAIMRLGGDGSSRESRSSVQETFTIAPPEWDGLDYALLASNVNCLLCHTTIDNVERVFNDDLSLVGTFDEVRVGSIDAIHFRSDPDSTIAGVTLIGGDAIEGDGHSITDWSAFNLRSVERGKKKIKEDRYGSKKDKKLKVFDPKNPDLDSSLFLDFFKYGAQTDFTLPSTFPSPFADTGGFDFKINAPRPDLAGNRIIDDPEFEVTVKGVKGQVSGGSISVIAKGDRIGSGSDMSSMMGGNVSAVSGVTDGNVYLHGTESDPLILDGDIAVDGDVIISGFVKGMGTLRARGNVYVTSDLVYNDAGGPNGKYRKFGHAADGTENNLAIASGGNIVIGDFYRPGWGDGSATDGTSKTSFNFTMDELAIFNRIEWMKTQPTLPGKTVKVKTGTRTVYYNERYKQYYKVKVPRYVWKKTGKKLKKTAYKRIKKSNGKPAPYTKTWNENVFSHHYFVDEKARVQQGTRDVTRYKWVYTGNKLSYEKNLYGWDTPQHPNPYYKPQHKPRYYNFAEGQKIPIFNKKGYFDPSSEHWLSDEQAGGWDDSKLSYADPNNSKDGYLFNPDGSQRAVVSSVSPTADWIDPALMRQVIEHGLNENAGGTKTLQIDATLYSGNSILGTVPSRKSPTTDGTLQVNGGLVASDVGILAPTGTDVNYDVRGARALSLTADVGLEISRRLSAPVVGY